MRIRKLLLVAAAAVTATAFAGPASAAAGDIMVHLNALYVGPDASGTVYTAGGPVGKVSVTDSVVPLLDIGYFLTDHWAVNAIAGVTHHSAHVTNVGDIGSVWLLPPIVSLQYHFLPDSPTFQPYVGLGVNYTFFFDPHPLAALAKEHYKDNWGWALEAGVDVPIAQSGYYFNVDVKKLFLSTDVTAASGAAWAHDVHIDPWLVSVGVGFKF
ncbi:MAG: OmpW family protein [Pseudomonadota bacterium]|nr:OmpW family protein [Pseudomonadota bacterium]